MLSTDPAATAAERHVRTKMRTRVKICGCTSLADVELAIDAGADAAGFIFAPSARRIALDAAARIAAAVPPYFSLIGVFIDPTPDELRAAVAAIPRLQLQFSGSEPPELCRTTRTAYAKVIHVDPDAPAALDALRAAAAAYADGLAMFETVSAARGGSGRAFAWSQVAPLARERRVVVSGGLTPENVGRCVAAVGPFAVDVRSGVESGGAKDAVKVRAFVAAVREADAQA